MKNIFLTGTIVYGPFTEKSDIDIVINPVYASLVEGVLSSLGIYLQFPSTNPTYQGFSFQIDNFRKIQIIVPDDNISFQSWDYATQEMKKQKPILDRSERIKEFRRLFDLHCSVLHPAEITEESTL